jgi:hypothetical protein
MQKNIARAISPSAPVNVVLGNFKTDANQKVRLRLPEVQSPNDSFAIEGMRSYNPDTFISSGVRALRMMVTAIRLHATGYTLPINTVLLPYVRYEHEIPKQKRGARSKFLDMGNPYVLAVNESLAAFCNSIAPDTAVYPIQDSSLLHGSIYHQDGIRFLSRSDTLYIAITDRPMTRKEAREAVQLGFPIELMPKALR